jgi:hypothetical protein
MGPRLSGFNKANRRGRYPVASGYDSNCAGVRAYGYNLRFGKFCVPVRLPFRMYPKPLAIVDVFLPGTPAQIGYAVVTLITICVADFAVWGFRWAKHLKDKAVNVLPLLTPFFSKAHSVVSCRAHVVRKYLPLESAEAPLRGAHRTGERAYLATGRNFVYVLVSGYSFPLFHNPVVRVCGPSSQVGD